MPERRYKAKQKYPSDEVQGPDSWVEIRTPSWRDLEMATERDPGATEDPSEIEVGKRLIRLLVEDWNWVDDNGDPLPEPTPETLDELPMGEMLFLFSCIKLEDLNPKV